MPKYHVKYSNDHVTNKIDFVYKSGDKYTCKLINIFRN